MKRETLIEKGYTEEQVSDLLNLFHNDNSQTKVELEKLRDYENKYNDLQKQMDEINKSKMTEQEKIEADKKAAEENLKKSQIIYNTAKAKEILAGYNVTDDLIKTLVNGDETSTINSANQLKSLLDNSIESTTLKVKEELSNLNVKPNPSNVSQDEGVMTKEKFDKLTMSEQKAWKDANIEKYHEFYPQN